ncbi:MAG: S8 family serine peptidase [Bacteroidia bacterium]
MNKYYLTITLLLLSISFTSFSQSADWQLKIDPVVLQKLQINDKTEFVAILKEQANTATPNSFTKEEKGVYVFKKLTEIAKNTQEPILSLLNKLKAEYQSFWIINAVSIVGDNNILNQVAQLESVAQIIENAKYVMSKPIPSNQSVSNTLQRGIAWGVKKTQADAVWALGYKGQGVVVGGQDTGYEWTHPAINKQYRGNGTTVDHNYNWHDCVKTGGGSKCGANTKAPCDDQEHGTHTMGTIIGYDGGSNQIGMAPEAKWIGCRNMNVGAGKFSMYVEGFEWFLAPTDLSNQNPDPLKAPHVINNSWECPTSEGCNSSNFPAMEKAVENLRNAGVVVVVSAGNDGPSCSTIKNPSAIFTASFTVGSTTSTDATSSFSSRGPVTNYGPTKISPDISAPGSDVYSCIPGNSYKTMSGTSMAGPHVAGVVALVISANPSLAGNVDRIEEIIKQSAVKLKSSENCGGFPGSDIPNNAYGNGRIDALAAVKLAIGTVSVKDRIQKFINIKTYPNPFAEKITFELSHCKTNSTLQIYSLTGQLVNSITWQTPPSEYELDMSKQAPGAYFYEIKNGTDNFKGKIFKVK